MNKTLFLMLIIGSTLSFQFITTNDNIETHLKEIQQWQSDLNKEFNDSAESCLTTTDRLGFHSLDYYPINYSYRVVARFERTENEKEFGMKTTTDRLPVYIRYGIAHFTLNGKKLKINIYQNVKFAKTDKYKNYLFMLFTDKSSGKESYAGGRYIDLRIPYSEHIIIDFNKAYNPYCAYNHKYSCPIPPDDDYLDVNILAGCKTGFH